MTMLQILPVIAYALAVATILMIATGRRTAPGMAQAALVGLACVFAGVTGLVLWQEGVVQFWDNHTTTIAGNQVWFDLLIAVSISFFLIAPRARAVGMPLLPWAIAVVATASVALVPMLARLLWMERQRRAG